MRPVFILASAALFSFTAGCHQATVADTPAESGRLLVTTAIAQGRREVLHYPVTGTVRPAAHARVASHLLARVERADLALGRSVHAGEVLVQLDAADLQARLAQAEATENRLSADLTRDARLLKQGAAAADQVRALGDQLLAARAATAEARALLAHASVTAPFDGVITRRYVNAGDLATPGTPLFELENRTVRRAELDVPASLRALPAGAKLTVHVAEQSAECQLVEISSAISPANRTRLVKAELPAGLPADFGAYARADWPAGQIDIIAIPAAALRRNGQMEQVFVVQGGRAALRLVKTDGTTADPLRIAAGLSAGEHVIINPSPALRDGSPVEIAR